MSQNYPLLKPVNSFFGYAIQMSKHVPIMAYCCMHYAV
jgi:hypothetical protein